eukprot:7138447-Alexandrium_andersonii.AAC.1
MAGLSRSHAHEFCGLQTGLLQIGVSRIIALSISRIQTRCSVADSEYARNMEQTAPLASGAK